MARGLDRFVIALAWLPIAVSAAPRYTDWEPATHLGCLVNSTANDQGPAISKDGLSLYFWSDRLGGAGGQDIWVARRASPDAPWDPPSNLGPPINTAGTDGIPSLSRDGHWMFFNSNRMPGGFGDIDLWVSYRHHVHDDFAWEEPVNLGPGVNTDMFDAGAGYFENEKGVAQIFFNRAESQANQTQSDIYVATFEDGQAGNAVPVSSLNSPRLDSRPSVRFDGLEVIFFSSRVDDQNTTDLDLWASTRNSLEEDWSTPVRLSDNVNTASAEANPYLSADGTTLFFASNRTGSCGGLDLYMTTRTKLKGKGD